MWNIKNPEIRNVTLDFTSSDQGKPEVSQLIYEDAVLMNAIEYIDFDEDSYIGFNKDIDAFQIIICDHCGITQCSSGGWVCFRKSGDYVLLIPAFELIEADEWNDTHYAPPNFYDKKTHKRKKDTPYFDLKTYEKLRKRFPKFPNIEQISHLKMSEAMRLVQFNMPMRFFGTPPEVFLATVKKNMVVGASKDEALENLKRIEQILKTNYENDSPALIRKPMDNEEPIYLFIDANEFIDWQALVKNGEDCFLFLEENFVVEEVSK